MLKVLLVVFVGYAAAAPASIEEVEKPDATAEHGRELFPLVAAKARRAGLATRASSRAAAASVKMLSDNVKGPINALEMLALNDDMNTVVESNDMCTRRKAMARAAGLAAGLALATVNAPGFAAAGAAVKMGSDSGQLVFIPDEIKICKGDTVTWTNNKGGPHNVVFDEDAIPSGVSQESISMDDQLGDEGATYTKSFSTKGSYGYYCEPHAGAGMLGTLIVE